MLHTLIISDSSLSFPPSPPELLSVTELSAERVTSQSYEGVLSTIHGVRDIDVSIDVAETSNTFQITTASRPTNQAMDEQFFVHIRLHALTSLTTDRKIESGETIGGLSLLFEDQTKNQQRLHVSGVMGRDEEALVDLFVKTKQLTYLNSGSGGGTLHKKNNVQNTRLEIQQCQLSTEMTDKLWSCLRSFTSLKQLSISDSSLSFFPSPPELPSVTNLSAERVTSQCYEGVLSSIPGVRDIDVSIDVAETSNTFQITTASRPTNQARAMVEQLFVHIRLHALTALTTDRKIESGKTIGGLSLLFEDQTKNQQRLHVSGVKGRDEEALVDLFVKTKQLTYLNSGSGGGTLHKKNNVQNTRLEIEQCQLSTEMTTKLWCCLRSFTSLDSLSISDSSLSFPPSPPELPSVTELSAKRVTSQSYEGLLSSLPGLREIDITIDDAERDIPQFTACLRRTGGQQLIHIKLRAASSLPSEKKSVSRETMRGLGLLIREQTKNLQWLNLSGIKCLDEEDLVELVESSTYLKALDRLHLQSLDGGCFAYDGKSGDQDECGLLVKNCQLSTVMTARMWPCLRSFTSLNHLSISDSSLSFPSSPPELPSVTKLSAKSVTSQSYEGLLSSLPGLREIDITFDDAKRDIPQITACLRRTGGQQLTRIELTAPYTLLSEKRSVSRETMRGLGLLIREQTKNLQWLRLFWVKCTDEEDLVDLIECCRHVKTMSELV
ncbi:uncharacterized protein LOC105447176 [Strongylocentrotus purpuratus]|uniref:Uncharacterized protein n=1 Tax=Strongylocentrotus purpuratus TaxID=7668 RepID=A0A7M7PBX9_STRPU|nr:uncharacterized protein LOC105447176 [Strongylocentrotus purpuratus]